MKMGVAGGIEVIVRTMGIHTHNLYLGELGSSLLLTAIKSNNVIIFYLLITT